MEKKIKIYLCDLVHIYLGVGTYMFPLNIGYIAAFANKIFGDKIEIDLFKYPEDFMAAMRKQKPDLVGFSNYTWSANLNNKMAEWVKSISPETIVVFGGPNINYSETGYRNFFNSHKATDFYVLYQGEISFSNILSKIFEKGLDISLLKSEPIDGIVFYDPKTDKILKGNDIPRIKEPDIIPSPYLTGLLDKFFNTNLIPIVETNRGCPYRCTYCCQGFSSFSKIEFYSLERVKKELSYIAHKIKNTNILIFADSNFGVVERDVEIAKYIASLTEETGYPRQVTMNWAKNQPKIFEIAKILNNTCLVISLQSLDEIVLKNIKRNNIQISVFRDIIGRINQKGGISGTEIILALPGETKESHLKSIRQLFDWNVSYIICYNCLILEGSEMSLQRERGEFKCETKFRLIDNSFGEYGGVKYFEAEEGIRSTETISEKEILYFRPVHWLIHFLWNYRFYFDLLKYLQFFGINPLDFITELIDRADANAPIKVKKIFEEFKIEAGAEWFDSPEALKKHYDQPEHFGWLVEGNYGKMNNKYVFRVLMEAKEDFEEYLYNIAISMCGSKKQQIRDILNFLSNDIIDLREEVATNFKEKGITSDYNILEWRNSGCTKDLEEFYDSKGSKFILYLPQKQEESLKTLLKQYNHKNKNVTLRKMSEYMDIKDFFYQTKLSD